jgi:hypothetical protein
MYKISLRYLNLETVPGLARDVNYMILNFGGRNFTQGGLMPVGEQVRSSVQLVVILLVNLYQDVA